MPLRLRYKIFKKLLNPKNTYQCNLNVCKKADNPSISTNMARVKNAQTANITYNTMAFTAEPPLRPIVNKRCHNTADSSGEKREKN